MQLLLAAVLLAQQAVPKPSTSFAVAVADPESGSIKVEMTVTGVVEDEVRLALPAWAPGAYRVVTYAKALKNFSAVGPGGAALETKAVDEQTWAVSTKRAASFVARYTLDVERSRMDKDHCYVAGPDTYLYVVGRKELPCSVRFTLPEGWKVGTGLDEKDGAYAAVDYDTFIDCPTELGTFELHEFAQDGATYQLVIHTKGPVNASRLMEMCRKVVREQNKMFGGPPFKRYVFLYHFRDGVGGRGLEHLNSTDIVLSYAAVKMEPLLAASITSHEYFHLWNVKRIRPFELGPFDYTQPVRSKALWFCEGVTSYFGDRALPRAGLWSEEQYLAHLAQEVETLQNNPDRKVTSIEKAGEVVWDRKDWPRVDYYNKGELLGLLMDLRLRAESAGEKTFDDVMRHLYDAYVLKPAAAGKGWIGTGFPEDGILKALNEVSGKDWTPFYVNHVSGVRELPYVDVLGAAGLNAQVAVTKMADLGVDLRGTVVMSVPDGSEAKKAGLLAGDRLGAIGGVEVNRSNLRDVLGKFQPGDDVPIKVLREGGAAEVTVKVGTRERTACRIRRAESPTPQQKRLIDAWLGKKADY
ncbi:MAG TPA: PDZ domain-containing protein [Planctomycetota bacterium]